jgi:hypothetical protein
LLQDDVEWADTSVIERDLVEQSVDGIWDDLIEDTAFAVYGVQE